MARDGGAEVNLEGPAATPSPSGEPLALTISCYVDPAHKRPRKHAILLHPDWSVDTGHDLDSERLAVAFGGHLSCLDLADKVVPAVRSYVQRQLRRELPAIDLSVGGRWVPRVRVATCCAGSTSFGSAADAASHLRHPRHVAAEHGARTTAVLGLGKQVLQAHGCSDPVRPPDGASRLVGRQVPRLRDVHLLWEAGLTPDLVEHVHGVVSDGRVLEPHFYLGVLSQRPDLAWVRDTAAQVPDRDVHSWLAWSQSPDDRTSPQLRADWLRLGVSRRDLTALSGTGYRPVDVHLLATSLSTSPTAAAAVLARWAEAECFPTAAELVAVARISDVGLGAVSRATVDRFIGLLRGTGITGSRVQHAFALMLCGAPGITAHIVCTVGSLDPGDITRGLHKWERDRQKGTRISA